jgi:hypothetical protein
MTEWSKDHVAAISSLNSKPWFSIGLWITWDRAGPLGGKWRPYVGKIGEWYVESRHLQGYRPRLCRLRTDGLAPASKYWTYRSHTGDMDPVSLVACRRHTFGFLHYFFGWEWERNWMETRRSVSRCAGDTVENSFFLGVVTLFNSVVG